MAYKSALAALSTPTRRAVFERIVKAPRSVGEIAQGLPVSRPAVSQHLKVLREAGLVQEERIGARHFYRLDNAGLEILRAYFDSFWERSLTVFKEAVEQSSRTEPSHPSTTEEA